jgi:hypothetical protein
MNKNFTRVLATMVLVFPIFSLAGDFRVASPSAQAPRKNESLKETIKRKSVEARKYKDRSGLTEKEKQEVLEELRKEVSGSEKIEIRNGEIRIVGTGGDSELQAVQKYRQVILKIAEKQFQSLRLPLTIDQLEASLKAEVLFSDKILLVDGARKAAVNFSGLNVIVFDRALFRDMNEREQLFLVFHETLGLHSLDLNFEITSGISLETIRLMENSLLSTALSNILIRNEADKENDLRLCIESVLKKALYSAGIYRENGTKEIISSVLRKEFQIGETQVSSGYYILRYKAFQAMDMALTSRAASQICVELKTSGDCQEQLTKALTQNLMNKSCR